MLWERVDLNHQPISDNPNPTALKWDKERRGRFSVLCRLGYVPKLLMIVVRTRFSSHQPEVLV